MIIDTELIARCIEECDLDTFIYDANLSYQEIEAFKNIDWRGKKLIVLDSLAKDHRRRKLLKRYAEYKKLVIHGSALILYNDQYTIYRSTENEKRYKVLWNEEDYVNWNGEIGLFSIEVDDNDQEELLKLFAELKDDPDCWEAFSYVGDILGINSLLVKKNREMLLLESIEK